MPIMKNLNLNVEFTTNGSAFIRSYEAVMLDNENNVSYLLKHSTEEDALKEAKIFEKIGYQFLYITTDIIFIQ